MPPYTPGAVPSVTKARVLVETAFDAMLEGVAPMIAGKPSPCTVTLTGPVKPLTRAMVTKPLVLQPRPAGSSNSTGSTETVNPTGPEAATLSTTAAVLS